MNAQTIFFARRLLRPSALLAAIALGMVAATSAAQTNFGAVNLGVSATDSVTVTLPNAATLGSIAVVTQGAAGMDFLNAGGGSCAAGTNYTSGESCTVQVTFKPLYAGGRFGAVLLMDGSGKRIAMALLVGNGAGPQIAFAPGAAVAFAPPVNGVAIKNPFDPAVDSKGDAFFTDSDNGRVIELPAGSGAPIAIDPIVGGSGLSSPGGVAVDAAGNLYISDLDRNIVVEVPADGSAPVVINPTVNGTGLHYPCGMLIDGAGDLYIADVDNGRVVEVPAGGAAPIAIDPLADGEKLSYPVTLAMDGVGDLFIADLFANRVVEVPAGGGAATAIDPSVNGQSLDFPYGIAIDAAGDMFIADADNRVVEVPAGGGAATAITPMVNGQGLNDPIGIALDPAGDLLIADSLNNRLVELMRSQAPAINFAATGPGTVSSDSPKTVVVQNAGNTALTLAVPGTGANPSISANFTLSASGASACPVLTPGASQPATLAPGATCELAISFTPAVSGTVYGTLALTDNNLNASAPNYATQTIALSSDAPVAVLSATMLAFGAEKTQTASAPQQVTLTNPGSAALEITNIAVTGANASSFSFPNPCASSLAPGANCVISGHFMPGQIGPMTADLAITDNAAGSPQMVALTGAGVYPVTVGLSPSATNITTAQSLMITATVSGATGEPAPSGSIALASGSYNLGTAILSNGGASLNIAPGALAAGTDTIVATYTPDSAGALIYAGATGQTSITVTASSTATAPAAATGTATLIGNWATLTAAVNPNGADTHAWFLWGTSSTLSGATQTAMQDLGSATASNAVSADIWNLSASTTYYYQVVAQNSVGTTNGTIASFTTDPAAYFQMVTGTPINLVPGAITGNTTAVSVTPWYGFAGTVNLTCAITPVAASDPPTCSLPASVPVSGENASMVTLTVNTTAAMAMNGPARLWRGAGGAALACVVLLCLPLRRRRWLQLAAWVVLFAAVAGTGCGRSPAPANTGGTGGGGGGGGQTNPGTTPGIYTVMVTGVSGGMTATGTVALTVQ
jgi:sugar lactone lactonase YvrE